MAWYNTVGKSTDTVISSRVRLARNISGYPFASKLDAAGANEIIEKVSVPLESAGFRKILFSDISPVMATSYVERHYVSPEFATKDSPHALLLQETGGLAVMVCEEDHLRIQSILPGLALDEAYKNASRVEKRLDEDFDFAYSEQLGYLTHCPTNLGTGMRASVMMFLPALSMGGYMDSLAAQLSKIGLTVRALRNFSQREISAHRGAMHFFGKICRNRKFLPVCLRNHVDLSLSGILPCVPVFRDRYFLKFPSQFVTKQRFVEEEIVHFLKIPADASGSQTAHRTHRSHDFQH